MDHNGSFSEAVQSLTQLDALLQSLSKHSSLKTISAQGINEMKDGVERIRRRIKEQKLTVAVMALTKSGESVYSSSKPMHVEHQHWTISFSPDLLQSCLKNNSRHK